MRNPWFISGFSLVAVLFIVVNAISYVSERETYYTFLRESGWTWAGHWTWGVPFRMVTAGLGFDDHWVVLPVGLFLNLVALMIVGGLFGIGCVMFAERIKQGKE